MIQKHEDLGDLVTTETEWYRVVYGWWDEEDKELFEEENGVVFCVVDRSSGMFDSGRAIWGFSKRRPLENLIEENGEVVHKEEMWHGKYLGIRFANNELIEYNPLWDDEKELDWFDSLIIKICNEGRCNGIINMEGDRCDKKQYYYDKGFCATCKKYDDKVKAGKLRECKHCTSTYHSTRSCELNPKVIAEKERIDAIVRRMEMVM